MRTLLLLLPAMAYTSRPLLCAFGEYANDPYQDDTCLQCPAGQFKDSPWWADACQDCPQGRTSGTGSAGCVALDTGATTPLKEDDEPSDWTAGGIGVVTGASVGVVYYTATTTT